MDQNPALSEQGMTEFPLQVEVEEDIEQEIETFVRFKRLGQYAQAHELFQEVLIPNIAFFPVVAEYADLLLEEGRYGTLSKFLDIQIECMDTVFESDEVELLCIMRSLAQIHTKGALRAALDQASKTWVFLQRIPVKDGATLPSDVQIHAFEIYINIIVFAMNTSGWVKEAHMECPWQIKTSERTQCGFLRWYQALSESNDDWNASRVLIAVLKILPSLSPWDQKVVFAAYCFGTYKPDDPSLHPSPLSENETITGFVVSLSRAQALMDLALILRLRYPDGFQHGEPFTDWYLSYIAALKYHSLASKFLASIQHNEEVNMHRVRFAIQDTRLADFLRVEFQSTHSELEQLPIRMRIFPEWIVPLLLSSDAKSTPDAVKLRDCKFDLLKLLNIQLHENEDMVGYLETCALLYTAAPRIPDSPTSINNDDQDDGSPLFQVKFDTLVLQTLDVALWLKGTEPIEKFNRLILDTSSGIVPLESTQDATVENSTLKEENKKPEALDIPLHLLFLNVFRGTSPEALYDLDPGFLPSPISHIEIETTAGVIRDIFEAELESTDPLGRLSFLTNEIPTPAEGGEFRFTLLSSMSRVLTAYQNARVAFQSIQRKWSVREPLDIGPPILALEDSLDYAEKDIAWRWHNHIFHCGFRCESDDPITGYQMKHIVAMLEETISNHLNPSAETDITRDITAALSSVTLAHRFTKSILFDQRQRIAPALLPDNQFSSTRYRLNRVSHPRKDPHTLNHLDMRDAFVPFIQNDGDLKGSSRANEPHRTHSRDPQADTKKQNVPHSLNKTSISFAETIPPAKPLRLRTSEEDSVQFPISNTADGDNRPQVQRVYRSASVSKRLPARDLNDDERPVVEEFERHMSCCTSCDFSNRDFSTPYHGLCDRGQSFAFDLTRFIYSENGNFYSHIEEENGMSKSVRLILPRRSTATLPLLTAVENGMDLSLGVRDHNRSPYSTGAPWYPGGFDRGSRRNSSGIYAYPRRADSSLSRDSGYDSRAASAYSYDKPAYASLNLLSQSKEKGRTVRSSPQEPRRSRSRSIGRVQTYLFAIRNSKSEELQNPDDSTSQGPHETSDSVHSPFSQIPRFPSPLSITQVSSDTKAEGSTRDPSPALSSLAGQQTDEADDGGNRTSPTQDYELAMPSPKADHNAGKEATNLVQSYTDLVPYNEEHVLTPMPAHDIPRDLSPTTSPIDRKGKKPQTDLLHSPMEVLRVWFYQHLDHPYPSKEEQQTLMTQTGLSANQINNWFIHARRREPPTLYDRMRTSEHDRRITTFRDVDQDSDQTSSTE